MKIFTKTVLILTFTISNWASAQVIQNVINGGKDYIKNEPVNGKLAMTSLGVGLTSAGIGGISMVKESALRKKASSLYKTDYKTARKLSEKANKLYKVSNVATVVTLASTAVLGVTTAKVLYDLHSGNNSQASARFDNSDRANSPDKSSLLAQNVQESGSSVSNQ